MMDTLGFDPTMLQGLLAQFAPTEDEKKKSRMEGILAAGLSLLGAQKGQELPALGRAGLLGMATMNERQKELTKERGANITQALGAQKLAKDIQFTDIGMNMVRGTRGVPGAPTLGGAPGMPTGGGSIGPASSNNAELGFALAGKKDVADVLHRQNAITQGHGGTLLQGGNVVGQVTAQGTYLYPGGDMTKPVWYPSPQEAIAAASKQAGEIKGAESAAQAKYDFIPVPMGGGETRMMSKADALEFLRGQQQPPAAPGYSVHGNISPQGMQRIQEDASGQRPLGTVGVTPSPTSVHATNAAVDTGELSKRKAREEQVQNSGKAYEDITKQFRAGRDMAPHLANMEKLEAAGVFSGPAGAIGAKGASWINSMFPDANVSGEKLSNTQTYQSEIGKMQQAIAKSFPGAQSDAELRALTASLPDLMQTPQGRAQVRDVLARKNQDAESTYDSASQYYKQNGDLIGWKPPMFTPPAAGFGGTPTPKPTAAGARNTTVMTILKSNPSPAALEELKRKGYLE